MPENTRVVYGVRCLWWDSIDKASSKTPIPTCPHCGSPLFETESEADFLKGSAEYDKKHSGYLEFLKWLKGKCFVAIPVAKVNYTKETGKTFE